MSESEVRKKAITIQRVHVTGGLRRTGRFLLFNMHKLGAKMNSDDSRNGIREQQCQG